MDRGDSRGVVRFHADAAERRGSRSSSNAGWKLSAE
jgi:hypothetical protein